MAWYSFLTTTPKVADAAIDTLKDIRSGIDKVFFTQEEKADAMKIAFDQYLELMKTTNQENSAKSITRRILAILIMGSYLLQAFMAIGLYKIDIEWCMFILKVMKAEATMVTSVTIFYFGYYGIKQILKK